ncbi:MAG TPA: hypothetical protein PK299_15385 [Anaerolineales bacterium]|nr:hypothetical protein [Anaerolineales bacterium]
MWVNKIFSFFLICLLFGLSACQSPAQAPTANHTPTPLAPASLAEPTNTALPPPSTTPPPSPTPDIRQFFSENGVDGWINPLRVEPLHPQRNFLVVPLCGELLKSATKITVEIGELSLSHSISIGSITAGCLEYGFYVPTEWQVAEVVIKIAKTPMADPAMASFTEICEFYLNDVQTVLDQQNSGVTINCQLNETKDDYWVSEVGWKPDMSREAAHQLMLAAVPTAIAQAGVWEAHIPVSQIKPAYPIGTFPGMREFPDALDFKVEILQIARTDDTITINYCFTPPDQRVWHPIDVGLTDGLNYQFVTFVYGYPQTFDEQGRICGTFGPDRLPQHFEPKYLSIYAFQYEIWDSDYACNTYLKKLQAALDVYANGVVAGCIADTREASRFYTVNHPAEMQEIIADWWVISGDLRKYPTNLHYSLSENRWVEVAP